MCFIHKCEPIQITVSKQACFKNQCVSFGNKYVLIQIKKIKKEKNNEGINLIKLFHSPGT